MKANNNVILDTKHYSWNEDIWMPSTLFCSKELLHASLSPID